MSEFDRLVVELLGFDPRRIQTNRPAYPPYNVVKLDDDAFVVSLAVAGFGKDDIEVEYKEGELVIRGKPNEAFKDLNYLHKGIANRKFETLFPLDKHMEVDGVRLENGMLHIKVTRHVPEALKPKKIPIDTSDSKKKLLDW